MRCLNAGDIVFNVLSYCALGLNHLGHQNLLHLPVVEVV